MKLTAVFLAALFSIAAWSQDQITGITCQDYWDELHVAGNPFVFMDPIQLTSLDTKFIRDLLDPAGEPMGIERGELAMAITVRSCTYSRTGSVLVSCRPQHAINGSIAFRYSKRLGDNHNEVTQVTRSLGIRNLKLDIVTKNAPDEKGNVILQPVLELSFTAHVADGRVVEYQHEQAFGRLGPDNDPGTNWGRRCSFVTRAEISKTRP